MTEQQKVIEEISRLLREYGSVAEPFINVKPLLNQEGYLTQRRHQLEKHIQHEYLPGFEFEDNVHFRWHLRDRDDPFLVLRPRPPERYFETWLRAIFVPRVVHYRTEIAFAMSAWEHRNRWRLKKVNMWDESWSWHRRVRQVLSMTPIVGIYEPVDSVTAKSINRWRDSTDEYRAERRATNPPSCWYIENITLQQDRDFNDEPHDPPVRLDDLQCDSHVSFELIDAVYYRESWRWQQSESVGTPQCDCIAFATPARSSLWQARWRTKKRRQ